MASLFAICGTTHLATYWTPRQIRHSRATILRNTHPLGIEAVAAALGHSQVETSQIYARRMDVIAKELAKAQ